MVIADVDIFDSIGDCDRPSCKYILSVLRNSREKLKLYPTVEQMLTKCILHNHYKLPLKTEDCATENFQTKIIYQISTHAGHRAWARVIIRQG